MLPKIALLATGGTIASRETAKGLAPAMRAEDLLKWMPQLREFFSIRSKDVFLLDSSNIQPEEWQLLALAVKETLKDCDGIVITHGTDTMAYSAAALSFMLLGIQKPVVFTGSQLPLSHPFSDAQSNLREAFTVASKAPGGVYIAFHHKLIYGTRAVKMRTLGFDAFDSINAPPVAYFDADGLHFLNVSSSPAPRDCFGDEIDPRVFLLKLMPGTDPSIFDYVLQNGYRGLVIEAFGLGGLHYVRRNLVEQLHKLSSKGIITLVTTQCLYEKADFSFYEVGHSILDENVTGAHDMTTESAVAKLMWVLGNLEKRKPLLKHCLYHEMGSTESE